MTNRKLKIGHISFFAPAACGLYEASRDMLIADSLLGHDTYFFDAGKPGEKEREEKKIGATDNRAGFKLITADPNLIQYMDILIMHSGIEDQYLVKSQSPMIWVIHGKPLDCWRPENEGDRNTITLYKALSEWPRCKKVLYFWPEFKPFWKPFFPENKHLVFNYPVINQNRFNLSEKKHQFKSEDQGEYNILICDSDRTDICRFEMIIGCIKAAKVMNGRMKFHFIGMDVPILGHWKPLLNAFAKYNALGEISGRVMNIEEYYRACHLTISPNRINNRVLAESLCCGTPILNQFGQSLSQFQCDMSQPNKVANALLNFTKAKINRQEIIKQSKNFYLENYSRKINLVYEELLEG